MKPERWTVKKIEGGHAILMGADARMFYPREFAPDEVIEWEHGCSGAQQKNAQRRARLIAAAPELLALCKEAQPLIEEWLQGVPELADRMHAAIAKAEGRQP